MHTNLPDAFTELLGVYAPHLNRSLKWHEGGDTWHVIGTTYWHPTMNAVAVIICHSTRKPERVPSTSGGFHLKPRQTTRFSWKVTARDYSLYVVNASAPIGLQITCVVENSNDLLTTKRDAFELNKYWLASANE
jgi:hypothetical protein